MATTEIFDIPPSNKVRYNYVCMDGSFNPPQSLSEQCSPQHKAGHLQTLT